jgi:hypothetical protein
MYIKWSLNIPTGQKILLTFYIPRPFKIYPYWEFWYENIPSGNPARTVQIQIVNKLQIVDMW